jgi:DNA-binding transcriptional LysR family regulator
MPKDANQRGARDPALAIRAIDLKLVELFNRVYRYGNMTTAGRELGLSQPAVSRALALLREIYSDELFIRQQRGVRPTPMADLLAPHFLTTMEAMRATVVMPTFTPSASSRTFRIAMSDIGERYFMPKLLNWIESNAPNIRIEAVMVAADDLLAGLASGSIDLAVGFLPPLGKQVYLKRLFRERYTYVARSGHPLISGKIKLSQLRQLRHVVAVPVGTSHAAAIEKLLRSQRVRAPVALRVRSFLSIAPIVAESDLLALIPNNLALLVADNLKLQLIDPPVDVPGFDIEIAWHQRYHHDAALVWLRTTFESLFATSR